MNVFRRTAFRMAARRCLTILSCLLVASVSSAAEVEIDTEASILAVVTHKAGIAAKRAHNHLIVSTGYKAGLSFDSADPLATTFELEFAAESLAVDPWDQEQAWYPRLEELGVLDEPFTELPEKDRQKIRKSMLGDSQLDAAAFPSMSARVKGVEASVSTLNGVSFPYLANLVFEVKGKRVERKIPARYDSSGNTVAIEALGAFRFTEFGIEPFSAFFGAVRNEDEFHIYVNLKGAIGPQ